jgi:hypothetical protein
VIQPLLVAVLKIEQLKQVLKARPGVRARWHGCPIVFAFLFAHPDSDTMQMVDVRGDYFDQRIGDTWDLIFPGYYKSDKGREFEQRTGARPVGTSYTSNWYFSPTQFNKLREHVERSSERRWEYSGGADLVLVNGWLPEHGEPTIDWASTISGQVTDQQAGIRTLTLANIIERITRDLENAIEDASYGIGEVTDRPSSAKSHVTRDFMLNTLAGIAAALGARAAGA